ncbi:hypothetical protein Bca101_017975 [Brassica carinata]
MGVNLRNYCYVMVIVLVLVIVMMLVLGKETKSESLKNGYYSASCPRAESIVRSTVESHFASDPTISPGLLRLHFHDCFIQGCDGSILIKGKYAEQAALANGGLRGFEVIDDAKVQLELECPGVVSCADILALAARDAVYLSSGPSWRVPTGRKDGRISLASQASILPSPLDSVAVQKQKFEAKGLDTHDLVTLLGAHTIGQTDCLLFRYRLYNYTVPGNSDPTISPSFLTQLKTLCPPSGDGSERVALDIESPSKFDVSFFKKLRDGNGILESDQRLWSSDYETSDVVNKYASTIRGLLGISFDKEFAKAMVKMGSIEVKIGVDGELAGLPTKRSREASSGGGGGSALACIRDQGPSDDQCYSSSPAAIAAESSQHHLNLLASASSVATTTAVTARTINTASVDLSSVYTATAPRINSFITAGTSFFASPRNLKFEMYKIETVNGEMSLEPENMRMKEWLKENVKEEEYVGMKAEVEVLEEMMRKNTIVVRSMVETS